MSATVTPTSDMSSLLGPNPGVERIYDNVLAVVPAMTLPLIEVALWNTIEEFALRSTYFRDRVSWQMAPGVNSVQFNPHSSRALVAWVLGQQGLLHWHIVPPGLMIDDQRPTAYRHGTALVALKPISFDVAEMPSGGELYSTWFETLLDGTLFRLYGQPAKPWSNQQLAQYHGSRFRMGINRARDIAQRSHSNQQGRWNFPPFAVGRRKN